MIRHLRRLSRFALIAAVTALCLPAPAQAAGEQAGVAAAVRGEVELVSLADQVGHQVESGEPIFLGDEITSGSDSGLQILLMDETVFTIGPDSSLAIDEFVYDPVTSLGKVTAKVVKGTFRFVSGKVASRNPRDMTVKLPNGTIGIRGTIAAGRVTGSGRETESVVMLLGPGAENNASERVGQIVVRGVQEIAANPYIQKAAAGAGDANVAADVAQAPPGGPGGPGEVLITRSGWGTTISGFLPPTDPALVPPELIDQLTSDLKSGSAPPKFAERGEMLRGAATKNAGQDTAAAIDTSTDTSGFAEDDIKNTDMVVDIPQDPTGGEHHVTTITELYTMAGQGHYYISGAPFTQTLDGGSPVSYPGYFDVALNINFDTREIGGNNSWIYVNTLGGGGDIEASTNINLVCFDDIPDSGSTLASGELHFPADLSNEFFDPTAGDHVTYGELYTEGGVIAASLDADVAYCNPRDCSGDQGWGLVDEIPRSDGLSGTSNPYP